MWKTFTKIEHTLDLDAAGATGDPLKENRTSFCLAPLVAVFNKLMLVVSTLGVIMGVMPTY